MEKGLEYKFCLCSKNTWEAIVVQDDEYFDSKSTIYYHCDECGEDFAILDFDTQAILYLKPKAIKE
ncbi:MAG: hypothetical protein HXY44_00960 [Syntrophaceae bacterium]|nr:hypothetical protein [Syntrophaceae bacterium]